MGKYCLCYNLDVGVTLIGFLHLNAALYWWARVSTFEPIYVWIHIIIGAMYTLRATYFFLMLNLDGTMQSRLEYFNWNCLTMYGLGGSGALIVILKWLEWGHPPTWSIVAWMLVGLFNWYHYGFLRDFAIAGGASLDKVEMSTEMADDLAEEKSEDATTSFMAVNKME